MQNKTTQSTKVKHDYPVLYPVGSLVFVAVCLALEYFDGGVVSHNLLNRADMPAISNWFGLLTLPLLGAIFASRASNMSASTRLLNAPKSMVVAFVIFLLYGGLMSAAFALDALSLTNALFMGLILLALVLPVYKIEYVFGFVVGMTFTFGGVLPVIVAGVLAGLSFVSRWLFNAIRVRIVSNKKIS